MARSRGRWSTPLAASIGVLVAWVVITGALHLDGLADVCDGWYGGRTPEERLRIMKDPHIGAMAAIGLNLHVLAPCVSRYAMALVGTTLPYARAEGGTGAAFVRQADRRALAGASIGVVLLSGVSGPMGLALLGVAVAVALLLRAVFRRTLGGVTGDALGSPAHIADRRQSRIGRGHGCAP